MIVGGVFIGLSLLFLVAGIAGLKRRQFTGVPANLVLALLMLSFSMLSALVVIGTQGYRAMTAEEVAATIETQPTGHQSFQATFHFPDGAKETFQISGDQLYVDAHILKWRSLGTLVGLKTAYELDRVGGRYEHIDDERSKLRTIHSLSEERMVDIYSLRKKHTFLDPLVDAEYGSATFIKANRVAKFELRVSNTGLLIRVLE